MSHRRIYAPWLEQWKVWTDDFFRYKKTPWAQEMMLYEEWPCATIFEDDVGLATNFSERVAAVADTWLFEGHSGWFFFFLLATTKKDALVSANGIWKSSAEHWPFWLVEWRAAGQHTAVWCHPLGLLHLGGNRYGFLETRRWVQVGLKWPIERLDLHPKECFKRCILTCAESLFYELSGAGNILHTGNPLEQKHLHIMGILD